MTLVLGPVPCIACHRLVSWWRIGGLLRLMAGTSREASAPLSGCGMRRDPVTPDMRLRVLLRDGGCVAPRLGGSAMDCFGRLTLEHVKDELRMGIRAPSDLSHLLTLCEGHTENGRRAGFQWNTAKPNRERMRAYLSRVSP